jgi:hypothetical protein
LPLHLGPFGKTQDAIERLQGTRIMVLNAKGPRSKMRLGPFDCCNYSGLARHSRCGGITFPDLIRDPRDKAVHLLLRKAFNSEISEQVIDLFEKFTVRFAICKDCITVFGFNHLAHDGGKKRSALNDAWSLNEIHSEVG